MGECTLHILDAARIKSQDAASDFVAEWANRDGEMPNSKIAAFLRELLEIYPENAAADGNIWYESAGRETPTAPVLPLVFKLSLFDADALKTLRTVAGKHRLHVFDEEGHVLYLANGKEVGKSTADPFAELAVATPSPYGLRYDGVYAAKLPVGWSYYRFTASGKAYRLSVAVKLKAARAFVDMVEGDPFVAHGKYVVDENGIRGKVKQPNGVFHITATLGGDALSVTSVRKDGKFAYSRVYEFAAL